MASIRSESSFDRSDQQNEKIHFQFDFFGQIEIDGCQRIDAFMARWSQFVESFFALTSVLCRCSKNWVKLQKLHLKVRFEPEMETKQIYFISLAKRNRGLLKSYWKSSCQKLQTLINFILLNVLKVLLDKEEILLFLNAA